jgi:hypothetical protein
MKRCGVVAWRGGLVACGVGVPFLGALFGLLFWKVLGGHSWSGGLGMVSGDSGSVVMRCCM